MNDHPTDDLAALLNGELELEELRRVVRHLRTCASCQGDLVEVSAATGALRRVERAELVEVAAEVEPSPSRSHRRRTAFALAAVFVLILALGAGIATAGLRSRNSGPAATVALAPPTPGGPASGQVSMSNPSDGSTTMTVATTLPSPPPGSYYEVWLLQPDSGQMLAVGVLPDDGTGTYAVPADIIDRYHAVDVSVQPDNGNAAHSNDSVLRARYS